MTSSLSWNDDYCIGHDAIDAEHKKLFEIAADVVLNNNPLTDISSIKKAVRTLYDSMKKHFEHEEDCMYDVVYTDTETHKKKHAEIIGEMNDILKLGGNMSEVRDRLDALMKKWLLNHILQEDLKVKKAVDIHALENSDTAKKRARWSPDTGSCAGTN